MRSLWLRFSRRLCIFCILFLAVEIKKKTRSAYVARYCCSKLAGNLRMRLSVKLVMLVTRYLLCMCVVDTNIYDWKIVSACSCRKWNTGKFANVQIIYPRLRRTSVQVSSVLLFNYVKVASYFARVHATRLYTSFRNIISFAVFFLFPKLHEEPTIT